MYELIFSKDKELQTQTQETDSLHAYLEDLSVSLGALKFVQITLVVLIVPHIFCIQSIT